MGLLGNFLATLGLLSLMPQAEDSEYDEYDDWLQLQNTELMLLWSPDQFRDFPISHAVR